MSGQLLSRLEADVGDLLETHRGDPRDLRAYEGDPVGFLREVLKAQPWERQEEIARAVRDQPLVTVRSCHAAGKDWLAARLALWWVYARGGMVLLTGPTAAQVEEILMRREVRTAFVRGRLPGELHVRALRPGGGGEAGILAKTGPGVSAMTGFHASRVLVIITEAQAPEIDHAWDAAFACATGAEDRVLTLGNPTHPDGRFYTAHRSESGWQSHRIAAGDIPNVREGRTVIRGLLTREGVDRFRREYGKGSPVYRARVDAEFPEEAEDSLVRQHWIERANVAFEAGTREHEANGRDLVLGVDPARLGPDRTAICIRQGMVVREFITWRNLDTMETADRIRGLVERLVRSEGKKVDRVMVDQIGLGAGVLDRLKEILPSLRWTEIQRADGPDPRLAMRHPRAQGFDASKRASRPDRFRNMKAQGFWTLRKLLEEDQIALPRSPELAEELTRIRVRFAADGRTEVEGKRELKARLGRSPDLADALVISIAPLIAREGRRKVRWV